MLGNEVFEPLFRFVGALELIEIGGHLDVGIAAQRRRRNAVVDLDREVRLLQRFVEVGERKQRHRVCRLEIERKLQVDKRQILAAAASDRGAETIERLGGAGLRRINERRQLLARRQVLHFRRDERMVGHCLVEFLINLQRFILAAVARQKACVSLDGTQRRRVGLVGALVALGRILAVVAEIEDQAAVQVLEDRVPIRAGEVVEGIDRAARIAGAGQRPCRQQRRRQIGYRAAHRLRETLAGERVLLLLERPHADDQPRDAVGAVDLDQPVGKLAGFLDITVGEDGEEGAAEEVGIARIGLEHVEVIGGRSRRVALGASMPRGQVAPGRGRVHDFLRCRWLRGERRRQPQDDDGAGNGDVPGQ